MKFYFLILIDMNTFLSVWYNDNNEGEHAVDIALFNISI